MVALVRRPCNQYSAGCPNFARLWCVPCLLPSSKLHPHRVCREEGNENLQLYSSGIVMRGRGLGRGTAHLDIKHLVKNCRWPEGILELTGGEVASFFWHFQGKNSRKKLIQECRSFASRSWNMIHMNDWKPFKSQLEGYFTVLLEYINWNFSLGKTLTYHFHLLCESLSMNLVVCVISFLCLFCRASIIVNGTNLLRNAAWGTNGRLRGGCYCLPIHFYFSSESGAITLNQGWRI